MAHTTSDFRHSLPAAILSGELSAVLREAIQGDPNEEDDSEEFKEGRSDNTIPRAGEMTIGGSGVSETNWLALVRSVKDRRASTRQQVSMHDLFKQIGTEGELEEENPLPVIEEDEVAVSPVSPPGPLERRRSSSPGMTMQVAESILKDKAHEVDLPILLKALEVPNTNGLTTTDAQQRMEKFGSNELQRTKPTPLWKAFLLQFTNLLIILLLASSLISIGIGEYVEGVAILIIVCINTVVAVFTEHSAGNALSALMALAKPVAKVIRDGNEVEISSREVVPGDIVVLQTGDIIPADCRVIEAIGLKVNEMLLTGEAIDVNKRPDVSAAELDKSLTPPNMVFSSTHVAGGRARVLVAATGMNTRMGVIAKLLMTPAEDGPQSSGTARNNNNQNSIDKAIMRAGSRENLNRIEVEMVEIASQESSPPVRNTQLMNPEKKKRRFQLPKITTPSRTPMQQNVHRLGLLMGFGALIICCALYGIGFARDYRDPQNPDQPTYLTMLLLCVSLAVSAIPEGLPLTVTICLAMGSMRMARDNALIRKLPAVEALGSVNVVCSDKTGTLTEGKMTAIRMVVDDDTYGISGKGFDPRGRISPLDKTSKLSSTGDLGNKLGFPSGAEASSVNVAIETLCEINVLCCNTRIEQNEDKQWIPIGNTTEAPLVVMAQKIGIKVETEQAKYPRVCEVPFSSSRKMMMSIHSLTSPGNSSPNGIRASNPSHSSLIPALNKLSLPSASKFVVCVKGAPNFILAHCNRYLDSNGKSRPMTDLDREKIMEHVEVLSGQALRVLGTCYSPIPEFSISKAPITSIETKEAIVADGNEQNNGKSEKLEELSDDEIMDTYVKDLVWVGMVGMMDPEREGVKESIATARRAGVRVVMITGDYLPTAVAIARNIDLIPAGADVSVCATDSQRLRPSGEYVSFPEQDEITSCTLVFARAQPEDKLQIVRSLQRQGYIVAMTGDGTNDAPALKASDIGVAMGSGTGVAKNASQIVLLDDNFSTIIQAIERGRNIYANVQKFVLYLLGTNIVQIVLIFLSVIIGMPSPLQPLQILFINLATDGLPALALSASKGESDVMNYPPRNRRQHLIEGVRLWMLGGHIFSLTIALFLSFFIGLYWFTGSVTLNNIFPVNVPADQLTCRVYSTSGWAIVKDPNCASDGTERARTMVFLTLCFTEIMRTYTVRWFHKHLFYRPLDNPFMVGAALLSLTLTLLVLLVPGLQTIFSTIDIPWFAWLLCLGGAIFTVIIDEYIKRLVHSKDKKDRRWFLMRDGIHDLLSEIRAVRAHVLNVETKLQHFELQQHQLQKASKFE